MRRLYSIPFLLHALAEALYRGIISLVVYLLWCFCRAFVVLFIFITVYLGFDIESAIIGLSKAIVPHLRRNRPMIILEDFAQDLTLLLQLVIDFALVHHADPISRRLRPRFSI